MGLCELNIVEQIDRYESCKKLCDYINDPVCDPKSELFDVSATSRARSRAARLGQCILPKFGPRDEEEHTGKPRLAMP